ncbi:MAG TPA: hypothetical protein VGF36_08780, partial [Rhodopila sp.]
MRLTVYVTIIEVKQPKPSESGQSHFNNGGLRELRHRLHPNIYKHFWTARTTGATRPAGSLRPHCACCHHPGAADHVR